MKAVLVSEVSVLFRTALHLTCLGSQEDGWFKTRVVTHLKNPPRATPSADYSRVELRIVCVLTTADGVANS